MQIRTHTSDRQIVQIPEPDVLVLAPTLVLPPGCVGLQARMRRLHTVALYFRELVAAAEYTLSLD